MDRVINEIECTPNEYTTMDLIEDLISEIQNYSEELTILFPERLFTKKHNADSNYPFDSNYSQRQLSSF